MFEKKTRLNSNRCFLKDFFDKKDLELFSKMAMVCIRHRLAHDEISVNHMRNLYLRLKTIVGDDKNGI